MSPLTGPLVGAAFALATRDARLLGHAARAALGALALTGALGAVAGLGLAPFAELLLWPSAEMASRGVLNDLLFAASVAVAGGVAAALAKVRACDALSSSCSSYYLLLLMTVRPLVAAALAKTNPDVPSLAGVAIAAALLPPAVNGGARALAFRRRRRPALRASRGGS